MGGVYCEDCDISPEVNPADIGADFGATMHVAGVFPYAIDHDAAERLWLLSEKLTGVRLK